MGIVDSSFQKAATGKCATPTTHLIGQFDYLAATYELFQSAESKTIVYPRLNVAVVSSVVVVNSACFTSVRELLYAAMMRLLSS